MKEILRGKEVYQCIMLVCSCTLDLSAESGVKLFARISAAF